MSCKRLHMDFETFSECDIRDVGAYRYAADKSTVVLCCAFSIGDSEPVVWHPDLDEIDMMAIEPYFSALRDPSVLITAHNCMFEYAVMQFHAQKIWGIPCPEVSRLRCTMSLARRASLPGKLEKLAEVLDLPDKKDARGKSLLRKFSMMQPPKKPTKKYPEGLPSRRIFPSDEPEAFKELLEYCRQDVIVEKLVEKKLSYFSDPINEANYTLDQRINARGVPVNLSALRHAQKLIDEETAIVSAKFRELTGFEVTQGAVFLQWLHSKGAHLDNLQAATIETFLDQWEGKELEEQWLLPIIALRLKQSIAYASIKKVKTMLECAGPHDARIRGLLNHHGAGTGRWTASLVQPQNFKRPTIKDSEGAYYEICEGVSREMLECCRGSVLEVISSVVRHFFQDELPNPILQGDYAAIEARIVCWLAGQEDALDRFRAYDRATGDEKKALDPYRIMASEVYNLPISKIEPFPHRFVGKELVLGAGFGLGYDRYRAACLEKGYDLPEGLEYTAIKSWRRGHKKIVQWWEDLENAAKKAILRKNMKFDAGKVSFLCRDIEGMTFLLMRLPSGRKIAYPKPRITPSRFEGKTNITYFGNIKGAMWGDVSMWGGVLANNATQGTDADVMFVGAHNCEREGYEIFNVVHDEAHAYKLQGQTGKRFVELMKEMPEWTKGLPVAAEGEEAPFYRKS